jgi:hypothetical protein
VREREYLAQPNNSMQPNRKSDTVIPDLHLRNQTRGHQTSTETLAHIAIRLLSSLDNKKSLLLTSLSNMSTFDLFFPFAHAHTHLPNPLINLRLPLPHASGNTIINIKATEE